MSKFLMPSMANKPLMISENYIDFMMDVNADNIKQYDASIKAGSNNAGSYETIENIAIINVNGVLTQRDSFFSWFLGGSTYETIRNDFRAAMDSSGIDTVIFEIDSGGGTVSGLFDFIDEIFNARKEKRIIAFINESAYSAAYAIASACSEIYIPRTGGAGSIGVIATHVDQSGYDEKIGVKYTSIFSGSKKNDFNQHDGLSESAYNGIKSEIDEIYNIFLETVSRNRNLDINSLRKMESGIYQGKNAVDVGLADGIMSYNELISSEGGMDFKETMENAFKSAEAEEITKTMESFGYSKSVGMVTADESENKINAEIDKTQKAESEANAAAEMVISILELCSISGKNEMALSMIKGGITEKEARQKLMEANETETESNTVNSTVNPMNVGEVNPLLADAENRK